MNTRPSAWTVAQVAAVLVGGLVGAGYASGRELYEFFGRHGAAGLGGLLLAGVLLTAAGGAVLDLSRRLAAGDYGSLVQHVAGPAVRRLMDPILGFGLVVGLSVTLAGAGELLAPAWSGPRWPVLALAGAFAYLAARGGARALVRLNLVLVPGLMALVWTVAAPSLSRWPAPALSLRGAHDGVLYFLYNDLLALALTASLGPRLSSRRQAFAAAGAAAAVLAVTAAAVLAAEWAHPPSVAKAMPLLSLASARGPFWAGAYAAALAAALFTTAVANAYALATRLAGHRGALEAVAAGAVVLAGVGFVPLVRWAYPLVGYAGAALLAALGVGGWRRWRRGGGAG